MVKYVISKSRNIKEKEKKILEEKPEAMFPHLTENSVY